MKESEKKKLLLKREDNKKKTGFKKTDNDDIVFKFLKIQVDEKARTPKRVPQARNAYK